MIEKTYEVEKCICCNGKGRVQQFDNNIKRWVASDNVCSKCRGKGEVIYPIIEHQYDRHISVSQARVLAEILKEAVITTTDQIRGMRNDNS